jgi:hypothetical protein
MKHKWKNRYEFDVGTATPGDPIPLSVPPSQQARRKYLKCPLCFEACAEGYWERHHSKCIHLLCPFCEKWFCKPHGFGLHLSRSQCGYNLLEGLQIALKDQSRTVVFKVIR